MKSALFSISIILLLGVGFLFIMQSSAQSESLPEKNDATIYSFQMTDITGAPLPLSSFKNKAVLIVNVASKCGFTTQYKDLEQLYKQYKDKGLVILGVPANNFMGQEPGTNKEIQNFCQLSYGVDFPMCEKVSVKGKDIAPLYVYLTKENSNKKTQGAISWNFNKFLIDKNGHVYSRYGSSVLPTSSEIVRDIEAILNETPAK